MIRTAIGISMRRKGMLKRQYGSQLHGRLPHRPAGEGPHAARRNPVRHRFPHLHGGAFSEFATGIGNTDAGFVMGTGKLLLKVPETMHFRLEGKLQPA